MAPIFLNTMSNPLPRLSDTAFVTPLTKRAARTPVGADCGVLGKVSSKQRYGRDGDGGEVQLSLIQLNTLHRRPFFAARTFVTESDDLLETAAAWLVEMKTATRAEYDERWPGFYQWMNADPRHREVYRQLEKDLGSGRGEIARRSNTPLRSRWRDDE